MPVTPERSPVRFPDFLASRRDEIADLCRRYHVRSLEVFGSALTDRFDPARSDVDLLVEFEDSLPRDLFEDYFPLKWALEALFGRSVDLVEPSAIRNPYLLEGVNRARAPLYAA